jgi:hypothetical protein
MRGAIARDSDQVGLALCAEALNTQNHGRPSVASRRKVGMKILIQ